MYSAASSYPTLSFFQWATPAAPTPRLSAQFLSTDTTIYWTSAPKDHTGAIITGGFIMGVRRASDGYVTNLYVPAAAVAVDGLSATGVVRIRQEGLDYTTADDVNTAQTHSQDDKVFCVVSPVAQKLMDGALQGSIGTGGANWRIGLGTDVNITVYAQNADSNKPFFRYDAATNQWIYSNDGVSTTGFGTGAGVTGGDGITVTAGDIDIDVTDTVIFKQTSAGAGDSGKIPRLNSSGALDNSFIDQSNAARYAASTTGNDTYVATFSPAVVALVNGLELFVKVDTANTGAATLNPNSLGATSILRVDGSALADGDIPANGVAHLIYNSTTTAFRLQNPALSPKFSHGITTRTGDTASGSQTIAHGLGRAPRWIKISARKGTTNGTASNTSISDGIYNGSTTSCVWAFGQAAASIGEAGNSTSNIIYIPSNTTGTANQSATVAVDATNITLTWTKTGSPSSDNINIMWESLA